jgi:hypothetical protein
MEEKGVQGVDSDAAIESEEKYTVEVKKPQRRRASIFSKRMWKV